MEFRVRWEIDVCAKTPEEAAKEALNIMQNKDSTATVFDVSSIPIEVDLGKDEFTDKPEIKTSVKKPVHGRTVVAPNSLAEKRRFEILGIPQKQHYGVISIVGIKFYQVANLIGEGFVDMKDQQNDSPTIWGFYEFLAEFPECALDGDIVSPERPDCRISFYCIRFRGRASKHLQERFSQEFNNADKFECDKKHLYARWD